MTIMDLKQNSAYIKNENDRLVQVAQKLGARGLRRFHTKEVQEWTKFINCLDKITYDLSIDMNMVDYKHSTLTQPHTPTSMKDAYHNIKEMYGRLRGTLKTAYHDIDDLTIKEMILCRHKDVTHEYNEFIIICKNMEMFTTPDELTSYLLHVDKELHDYMEEKYK